MEHKVTAIDAEEETPKNTLDLQQEKDRSEALVLAAKQKRRTNIKLFSSSATLTIIAIAAFILK